MSQRADISVLVEGIAGLLEAIAEAGAEYRAQRKLQTADGQTHAVDYVATDASGAEVGIQVDKKTQRVALIASDCEAGKGKALAGRIVQRYAYSKVLGELKRKGYQVTAEEKQVDGTVKVVMTRWR